MKIDATHPEYDAMLPKWQRVRDALDGDRVKAAGVTYLPKLGGMKDSEYEAYKKRALYYGATARTLQGVSGLVFRRETQVQAPVGRVAETLLGRVSTRGMGFDRFAQHAFDEAFAFSRVGVYVSLPAATRPGLRAFLTRYRAENIIDWDEEEGDDGMVLTRVVLKERKRVAAASAHQRAKMVDQWREVSLEDGALRVVVWRKASDVLQNAPSGAEFIPVEIHEPRVRGERLTSVPFHIINGRSLGCETEEPNLLPLADANFDHYRMLADLRHGLHFTALPTPYAFGVPVDTELTIGSGTAWVGDENDVTVGMLEFTGAGLGKLAESINDSVSYMASLGARLLEAEKAAAETAETHRLRQGRDQATVAGTVQNLNDGLSAAMTQMLNMSGVAGEVQLQANTDIVDSKLAPEELRVLVEAYQGGAISFDTFYHNLQRGEMTRPDVDADEERELLEATTAAQMTALPPVREPEQIEA